MEVASKSSKYRISVVVAAVAYVGIGIQNTPLHRNVQKTTLYQRSSDFKKCMRPNHERECRFVVFTFVINDIVSVDIGRHSSDCYNHDVDDSADDHSEKSGKCARGTEWLPWISGGCYYVASEDRCFGCGSWRHFLYRLRWTV